MQQTDVARAAAKLKRGTGFRLCLLLIATAILHISFTFAQPAPRPTGDELHYLVGARDDAKAGRWLPIPGSLRFGHRPEFASRWLAPLAAPGTENTSIVRRASLVNIALLLGLVALVFRQAIASGASERAALTAAALVASFPWLGFHVHSLWPEILHAFLLAGALLAALLHLRDRRVLPLALCGGATGVAILTKGSLLPFVPLFALFFAAHELLRGDSLAWRARLGRAGGILLPVYFGAILLVVGPQLATNYAAGHGLRLSANRWWNLELGVSVPMAADRPGVVDAAGGWQAEAIQATRYAAAAPRAIGRERAAQTRTLAYIENHGSLAVASAQLAKLAELLIAAPSLLSARQASFDQALGPRARWGSPAPAWIELWQEPARWAWRLLVPLGLLGLLASARVDSRRLFLALFALSFLAASAAVPVKIRFLLPIVPVLALGVGFLADRITGRAAT